MKKIFITLLTVCSCVSVLAQAPMQISYQAVVRNASNELLVSQAVGVRVSILEKSADGAVVYS